MANDLTVGNTITTGNTITSPSLHIQKANKNMLEIGSNDTSSYIEMKDAEYLTSSGDGGHMLSIKPSYLYYRIGLLGCTLNLPWRSGEGTLALDENQIYKSTYTFLSSSDDLNNITTSGTYYWKGKSS